MLLSSWRTRGAGHLSVEKGPLESVVRVFSGLSSVKSFMCPRFKSLLVLMVICKYFLPFCAVSLAFLTAAFELSV